MRQFTNQSPPLKSIKSCPGFHETTIYLTATYTPVTQGFSSIRRLCIAFDLQPPTRAPAALSRSQVSVVVDLIAGVTGIGEACFPAKTDFPHALFCHHPRPVRLAEGETRREPFCVGLFKES